jgi:NAD(P)-dependent dehydrogenase (short-subunit alcohol dehydrogenase family)
VSPAGYLEQRLDVSGRVAVIIGGAAGLGRASALELGRAGMRLAVADRDAERLAHTVGELAEIGVDVHTGVFDCRDADALGEFYASVDEVFGHVDVVVNVVGGTFRQAFEENTAKGWDALIRTNYTWMLSSIQLAIPRLRAAGGGSIINLGSIEGARAAPGFSVYAGLKAAVVNLGRSLAIELGPDCIRVNTVAPDYVPTEGLATGPGADAVSRRDDDVADLSHRISIPMARLGNDGDIGGCVLFLASDLSRFVTGTTLHPDGGTWASGGWFNWPEEGFRNTIPDTMIRRLGLEVGPDDGPDGDG